MLARVQAEDVGRLVPAAIRNLPGFLTNNLPANDDGSTGQINVGFNLNVGDIGIADYDAHDSPFGYHIIKRVK